MFSELSPEINYKRVVDGRAHWRHSLLKNFKNISNWVLDIKMNEFLSTLEILHFTFDIWAKNASITIKSWPKVSNVGLKNS